MALGCASVELRGDASILLEAVKSNWQALEHVWEACGGMVGDAPIMLEAVKQDRAALNFASEELKGDASIVLEAVKHDGLSLYSASAELQGDASIVLEAVKQDGLALEYASAELQGDASIVLEAVQQNGLALEYASAELQGDASIVFEAVKQNGEALYHATAALQLDASIAALRRRPNQDSSPPIMPDQVRDETASSEQSPDEGGNQVDEVFMRNSVELGISEMTNACVTTIQAQYDSARDGLAPRHRMPEGYSLWYEQNHDHKSPSCPYVKSATNQAIIGCHLNLNDNTVTFKTHLESELPPVSIPQGAQGVCPAIGVWDAACEIKLNLGESAFEYHTFVEGLQGVKPYRDGVKGTCVRVAFSPCFAISHSCACTGNSPQMCAAANGHWDSCKLMLEKYGASRDVKGTAHGNSLLHWFVEHDSAEVFKHILITVMLNCCVCILQAAAYLVEKDQAMLEAKNQDNKLPIQLVNGPKLVQFFLDRAPSDDKRSQMIKNWLQSKDLYSKGVARAIASVVTDVPDRQAAKRTLDEVVGSLIAASTPSNLRHAHRHGARDAVKQNGLALEFASAELQRDASIVLEAVKQDWQALNWASEELLGDVAFMMEAVKQNWQAMQHASVELKGDASILMEAVQQNGAALYHASEELKGDASFMMEVVKQAGLALYFASDDLKGEASIVLEAVKQNGQALNFASAELQGDASIVLEAVKQDGQALCHASEELKGDALIVLEAVKQDGQALPHASEELRGDASIVLEAVKQNGYALKCASVELQGDALIVLEAVKQTWIALQFASAELKGDASIVLEAVKQDGYALKCASVELQGDASIVMEAVKRNGPLLALEYASAELQADASIVMEAVKQNGLALKYASKELRGDSSIVLEAVKQNGLALRFASAELQGDASIVLEAVKQDGAALNWASEELQGDASIVQEAEQNESARRCASEGRPQTSSADFTRDLELQSINRHGVQAAPVWHRPRHAEEESFQ